MISTCFKERIRRTESLNVEKSAVAEIVASPNMQDTKPLATEDH